MVGSARAIRAPLSSKQDTIILRTALPTLPRRSFELKIVVGCRQIVVLASQRGSQLWGGGGAEKMKTEASRRGGGLRPSRSGTRRLEMPRVSVRSPTQKR
jgi:hypothetical protein